MNPRCLIRCHQQTWTFTTDFSKQNKRGFSSITATSELETLILKACNSKQFPASIVFEQCDLGGFQFVLACFANYCKIQHLVKGKTLAYALRENISGIICQICIPESPSYHTSILLLNELEKLHAYQSYQLADDATQMQPAEEQIDLGIYDHNEEVSQPYFMSQPAAETTSTSQENPRLVVSHPVTAQNVKTNMSEDDGAHRLRTTNRTLLSQVASLKAQLEKYERQKSNELARLQQEKAEQAFHVKTLQAKLLPTQQHATALETANLDLLLETQALQTRIHALEEELSSIRKTCTTVTDQNTTLSTELKKQEGLLHQLAQERDTALEEKKIQHEKLTRLKLGWDNTQASYCQEIARLRGIINNITEAFESDNMVQQRSDQLSYPSTIPTPNHNTFIPNQYPLLAQHTPLMFSVPPTTMNFYYAAPITTTPDTSTSSRQSEIESQDAGLQAHPIATPWPFLFTASTHQQQLSYPEELEPPTKRNKTTD